MLVRLPRNYLRYALPLALAAALLVLVLRRALLDAGWIGRHEDGAHRRPLVTSGWHEEQAVPNDGLTSVADGDSDEASPTPNPLDADSDFDEVSGQHAADTEDSGVEVSEDPVESETGDPVEPEPEDTGLPEPGGQTVGKSGGREGSTEKHSGQANGEDAAPGRKFPPPRFPGRSPEELDFDVEVKPIPYVHHHVPFPEAHRNRVPTYEEARAYYVETQGKHPPRLYKPWYDFAVGRKCNVLGAAHLSKALRYLPVKIRPDLVARAQALPRTSTIIIGPPDDREEEELDDAYADENGDPLDHPDFTVQDVVNPGQPFPRWQEFIGPFARWFPRNFRMVQNHLDEPRINAPGSQCIFGHDLPPAYARRRRDQIPVPTHVPDAASASAQSDSPQRRNTRDAPPAFNFTLLAQLDLHNPADLTVPKSMFKYHGYFFQPDTVLYTDEVLPLFSPTIVPHCYADIVFPSMYAYSSSKDSLPPDKRGGADAPLKDKTPVAVWRGTTTGGRNPDNVTLWHRFHRHRLVALSQDLHEKCEEAAEDAGAEDCTVLVDAHFMGYLQLASDSVYRKMSEVFGQDPGRHFMPYERQFSHRFLIDVDGNTFSSRLHTFMRESRSAILRARAFVDWIDNWAVPYVHYIPVRMDWTDIVSAVEWGNSHVEEAAKIAERGYELGRNGLRWEDAQCHLFAVMMEYEDRLTDRGKLPGVKR